MKSEAGASLLSLLSSSLFFGLWQRSFCAGLFMGFLLVGVGLFVTVISE